MTLLSVPQVDNSISIYNHLQPDSCMRTFSLNNDYKKQKRFISIKNLQSYWKFYLQICSLTFIYCTLNFKVRCYTVSLLHYYPIVIIRIVTRQTPSPLTEGHAPRVLPSARSKSLAGRVSLYSMWFLNLILKYYVKKETLDVH